MREVIKSLEDAKIDIQEQRRIVAKVDQLMTFCDELESKLNQSQTDGAKLMEAVVAGLVDA